ncbi:MAG: arginine decarboxylase, partial [Solirubrobacteraceae bacterium]|nr:arginine decarboxylase [Solirubrobacteraceae bacterium]
MSGERSEQPAAPYLDAIVGYGFRGSGRWHVPGHKGGSGADPGLRFAIGERALALDIPQDIHGIDVGPYPTPYDRAEQLAAEAHGAARTWFLTNGATQGNHALCLALAPLGTSVVAQRNAHASVVDGLVLSGGLPAFVAPEYDAELGMAHGV